ncbi:hypothetical protein Goshw_026219 [Gossypium schwendimanii]|uniref:RNase H type-1 domain-containing protein n=1 Tax=Gossypium schwendimanii TaxID=34291 RepID=A0A7J9L5X6_GOSSC|nr:hypothetical protein [Gossypium schwendimanii]
MLWHSWSNRNNYVFRGNEDEAQIVKLNFDATISKNKIGFGVIVSDFDGLVLSGGWGFKDEDMTVDWEKLYALEESLKITRSLNIPNAIFETDCASLANRVKKGGDDIIIIGYHIKEILKTMEMCNNAAVNWINRSCNKVADFICKYAIINYCILVFGMDYPKEIHDLVIDDSIN